MFIVISHWIWGLFVTQYDCSNTWLLHIVRNGKIMDWYHLPFCFHCHSLSLGLHPTCLDCFKSFLFFHMCISKHSPIAVRRWSKVYSISNTIQGFLLAHIAALLWIHGWGIPLSHSHLGTRTGRGFSVFCMHLSTWPHVPAPFQPIREDVFNRLDLVVVAIISAHILLVWTQSYGDIYE